MRLEIMMTAALFFGGTTLSGYALCRLLKLKHEGLLFHCMAGAMLWWAAMELILVPMTVSLASFRHFAYLYTAVVGVFSLAGLMAHREIAEDFKTGIRDIRRCLTPGYVIAFALILCQLLYLHHHMYLEWDDTYYVNLANEAVYSDKIYWVYPETGTLVDFDKRYVLSLWPIFYAWLSRLAGVAPTIMAHTILPWVMVPLAYMIYLLIAKLLFKEDPSMQGMFLAMAVVIHLFMPGEHISGPTFLSITPWVGKAALSSIILPALLYLLLRAAKENRTADWLLLGVTGLAGCLTSSMGILLIPVLIGAAVFLMAIWKKRIRLLLSGIWACGPCLALGIYYVCLTH